jgi:hypothetical protein
MLFFQERSNTIFKASSTSAIRSAFSRPAGVGFPETGSKNRGGSREPIPFGPLEITINRLSFDQYLRIGPHAIHGLFKGLFFSPARKVLQG